MTWTPLSLRLSSLPLLLAGPIVRRTEVSNISVWFVLKEQRNPTLNIYNSNAGGSALLTGNRSSGVGIGNHVFVYCVTARGGSLNTGINYYYDIDFGSGTTLSNLISGGLDLTFDGSQRPSFALPPDNLDQVRLIHGSCRKPHGEGYDSMEGVHDMIQSAVSGNAINAMDRPHQLFLTGDQIYADDVADIMLFMIDDAANALFGWDENYSPFTPAELAPGKRNTNNRMRNDVGFTGMLPNKPAYSKSHLLKFREYAAMYLFVWSRVLWPASSDFPDFRTVFPNDRFLVNNPTPQQQAHANESAHVQRFLSTITKIRKALANISTYMIFDDHEITDDWNLNWRWCKEVYSKTLGRRTVQNGLLAFALFQAWGNTPDQFAEPAKSPLLDAANAWRGGDDSQFALIRSLLNIPTIGARDPISNFPHHTGTFFNWHYDVQANNFAVYVQNSRTWRGYPPGSSDIAFAKLISQAGHDNQLPTTFPSKEIIIILAPCPVIGEPFVEQQQAFLSTWEERCDRDTEAWSLDKDGFERLFSNLASRLPIIGSGSSSQRSGRFAFLSGDVHYGCSARYQLWGNNFLNDTNPGINTQTLFAQLTASSFKNQTGGLQGTETLHTRGYPTPSGPSRPSVIWHNAIDSHALPAPIRNFAWYLNAPTVIGQQGPLTRGLSPYTRPRGLNIISVEELRDNNIELLSLRPNWRYRIDWILGTSTGTNPGRTAAPTRINVPPNISSRPQALQDYLSLARDHGGNYFGNWGNGKEIVGVNNLGEIRFSFSGPNKRIDHIIWWRMDTNTGTTALQLFPLTTFSIPMNFTGDRTSNPRSPMPIIEPTFNGL